MTIRLSFICHASTKALRAAAFPLDDPLDAFGSAAAARMGRQPFLSEQCWCGPELRCRQTAAALGLTPVAAAGLADWDSGRWAGSSLSAIEAREPDALVAWLTTPEAAPHGGESLLSLLARAGGWLDGLRSDGDRAGSLRIVAVTHPAVIRAALVHALRATPASFWRLDIAPLSRIELVGQADRWSLRGIVRGEGEGPADAMS